MIYVITACNKTGRFLMVRNTNKKKVTWMIPDADPDDVSLNNCPKAIRQHNSDLGITIVPNSIIVLDWWPYHVYLQWVNEEIIPEVEGQAFQWMGMYEMPEPSEVDRWLHNYLERHNFVIDLCNPRIEKWASKT